MTTFTIDDVDQNVRDVDTQYGAMKAYRLSLMGPDATTPVVASWLRKASSPAPVVGQQVTGDLEDGQYGKKFREAKQFPQGSSGGRSGSYAADPKKQAAIALEHSQKVAVDILKLAYEMKVYPPDSREKTQVSDMASDVRLIAAALYQQIEEVSK
jgi:hypothetical protein